MADKVPIRGAYNASSGLTGLANFASSETIGVAHGGTGIATVGTNQLVSGNGTGAMTSESNLTFDGTTLLVSGTASATSIMAADSGAALSSQDAKKIILVDLTDPAIMWDVEQFLICARYTSWYQELGAPPIRGAMWIDNAGTSLIWWNLDTDATYMTFEAATNKMLKGTSIAALAFLDGKIYAGGSHGIVIIDLVSDRGLVHQTGGINTNFSDIENRNAAVSAVVLTSSQGIRSDTIHGVDAIRDPSAVDEFDRPKHWWAIATDDGTGGYAGNVYNPINDAVYYSSMGADQDTMALSQSGQLWYMSDAANDDIYGYFIYGADADAFTNPNYLGQSGTNGGSIGNSGTATIADLAAFDAPNGFDGLAVAMSTGLDIGFITSTSTTNQNTESAHIFITSTYQTPYMKGLRLAAFPLNDVNDRSGRGYALTNNNTATFTSGIFGSIATFDGVDQYLDKTSGVTEVSLKSAMLWAKSTSATNPSNPYILRFRKASSGAGIYMSFDSSGQINMSASTAGASSAHVTASTDTYDAQWHHYAYTWASDGKWHAYIDGVEIGSASNANGGCPADTIAIGAAFGSNYFAGQMAMVVGTASPLTADEINLEYDRGIRSLGGATHTLANDSVKSERIAQTSGLAAITTAANQTEIWHVETGMRESIDATTTATINDADVRLKSGAILPEYITARSGAIEFDGQERNVLG